jgi:hypothetical protein
VVTSRRIAARAAAALLGSVIAVGSLVGCGGDDEPSESSGSPSGTEAADAGTTADYLPVPEGVELTAPGTTLGFGEAATIAWRPRQDIVVALDLTVERIDRTSFKESFDGWQVTKEMRGQLPYFVQVRATNAGHKRVGGLLVPLYGFSGESAMYEPLDFREQVFEPCPGGDLPKKLAPGKSTNLCFVYLLPEDQELAAAAFDVVGEAPVTWSGRITEIEKPKKDKKSDKKRKQQGSDG